MSSEIRPSFRDYSKKKLKKILDRNITSLSISERIISNETKNKILDKYGNISKTVIEQTGISTVINKTKTWVKDVLPSDDNSTIPKGFFDSLFYPQTVNDVYLKVTIICLWVVAMLSIISTIITMFKGIIPSKEGSRSKEKTVGIRRFFIHIFLCEFCYLIYILLSMINVGLDFQLNSFFCDIAKYGMYATVPIMYFVLLVLSFERITTHCKKSANKIFGNIFLIQPILFLAWIIGIVLTALFIYAKNRVKEPITYMLEKPIFKRFGPLGTTVLSGRCSIDGQLLPAFKILFLILFILLIILIIKSLAYTVIYSFFTPSFCEKKKKDKKQNTDHRTLIFILILLLNLVFSFPFYLISTANSILDAIQGNKPFPMSLKISFILRLLSIILQCFVFLTLESNSWSLLNKLLHYINCKKCAMLVGNTTHNKKRPASIELRTRNSSAKKEKVVHHKTKPDTHENGINIGQSTADEDESDDDDVFLKDSANGQLNAKKPETTENSTTDQDDSDDETTALQTRTLSTKKKDVTKELSQTKDKTENEPLKRTTSKTNHTNGISKPITNGKSTSKQTSSAITDKKTSKSNTNENHTKSDSSSSDSSTDDVSNASVHSDDGIKPSITKPKVQSIVRSNSNKQNPPIQVSSVNEHHSHHQRPRRHRSKVSHPIKKTTTHHNHTKPTVNRRKSPRNISNPIEQPKQDRISKILADSIEV